MVKRLALIFTPFFILLNLIPAMALAAVDCTNPPTPADAIQCGTDNAAGVPGTKQSPGKTIDRTITNVINLISMAVGITAVIMLLVGGFRYVTGGGNQDSIKSAKSTILYALIGLVIVALAQIIVNFVLNKTTQP